MGFVGRHALWPLLLVLVAVAELVSHGAFLQPRNLINILAQNSVSGTLAVGQTLVILTGGMDFSLGSVTALSSIVLLLLGAERRRSRRALRHWAWASPAGS